MSASEKDTVKQLQIQMKMSKEEAERLNKLIKNCDKYVKKFKKESNEILNDKGYKLETFMKFTKI